MQRAIVRPYSRGGLAGGIVRWSRPEFQNRSADGKQQKGLTLVDEEEDPLDGDDEEGLRGEVEPPHPRPLSRQGRGEDERHCWASQQWHPARGQHLLAEPFAGTMEQNHSGALAMNSFETTATVEAAGQVRVAGVPFEPGTEVEVTIKPTSNVGQAATAADRATALFAALDKARNTESVGPLSRQELYDRDVLR